ncbi:MAG TPA: DNA-3-methyladenine glycosylase [Acidimicrobiia bacterium]|nr:DNA-3-methyladenine glycosylase [Acidimicrobiia bacterium]
MARRVALPRSFYDRDARTVARELLGKLIVAGEPGEPRLVARIVEVEAYLGATDPASHAYRGQTRRNATMFGPPGRLYVYFTYGMHWCANAVCGSRGAPAAVLLRAAAPIEGVDVMRARRRPAGRDRDLLAGPARLAKAFGITGDADGVDLSRRPLRLCDDGETPPRRAGVSTRIGLRAGRGDERRWRWYVQGDRNLSRPERRVGPGRASSRD